MKRGKVFRLSGTILLIAALTGIGFYNRGPISDLIESVGGPELSTPKPEQILRPGEIETKVRSILEMPAYEHIYHNIIYIGEEARFLGIKHLDKRLLFSIDITVKAGVDLQDGIEITPTSTGELRIGLPQPEILLVDADEATIREYFAKEFGGEISRLEYYDEIDRSKRKTVRDAIDRGILEASGRHAKTMVENLLTSLGAEKSYVYFREASE